MLAKAASLTLCLLAAAHAHPVASGARAVPIGVVNPVEVLTSAESNELLENGCPVNWEVHRLLPHEECDKFYYCLHGVLVERICAPGTYFNEDLEVCDWPENVKCAGADNNENEVESSSEHKHSNEDNNGGSVPIGTVRPPVQEASDEQDSGGVLENGCPANFNIHRLLPHESSCSHFYACANGELVEQRCPAGTHFNPTIKVCDWPENAGCVNSGNSGEDSNNSGNNHSNEDGDNGGDNAVDVPEWLENGCPSDWDLHHLLAHETECNKFYYCVHGSLVERECAPGTHFNPDINVCDWPENAGCAGNGDDNNSGSIPIGTIKPPVEVETSPEQESSEDSNGGSVPIETIRPPIEVETSPEQEESAEDNIGGSMPIGTVRPPVEEASNEQDNGGVLENGCPANFNIHQLLPHESSCSRFYACANGELVEQSCPAGTHFNPTIKVCDWPENAGCVNSGNSGEDSNNSGNNHSNEDGDNGGDNVVDIPEWLENGCPSDFDVHHLLAHETECSKFYYCVHGSLVERECAPGTHFNPNINVCDWPENAGCAGNGDDNNSGSIPIGTIKPPVEVETSPEQESSEDSNGGSVPIETIRPPIEVETSPEQEESAEDNIGGSMPIGTVRPPVEEASNEQDNGGVLENGCPANFNIHQLLPHESSCSRFYACANGELVEQSCPAGTHFNPTIKVCDWPENAGCVNSGNSGEDSNNSGNNHSNEDGDNGGDNAVDVPEWLENGCPSDWDLHHLLAHETECNKFYYCVHGSLVERECAPGTHFNPDINVCDWPENAGCAGNGDDNNSGSIPIGTIKPPVEVETSPEQESSEDSNGGSVPIETIRPPIEVETSPEQEESAEDNIGGSMPIGTVRPPVEEASNEQDNGGVLENGCPANFNIHQLLPHESSCSRFYACANGELVEQSCPAGTHFNPTIKVCDWPENAGCVNSGNSGEDSNNSGNNHSNEDGDNGGDNVVDIPEWLENGCPSDFDVHHLLAHETECSKFYYCVHGSLVERECAPGTHFNPNINVCDWPENAGCAGNGDDNNSGSIPIGTIKPPVEVETSPEQESSEDSNGGSVPIETIRPPIEVETSPEQEESAEDNIGGSMPIGTVRPPVEEASNEQDNGGVLENGCPANFNIHQLLPHESSCSRFYACANGELVEQSCPAGTHFNPTIKVCDWPENAGCVNSGNSGEDSNNSGNNHSNEDGDNGGDNVVDIPEWLENGCPSDFDVHHLLAHETECSKFYYCVHGSLVERECAPGTHFNPDINVCDWPENAGCAGNGDDNNSGSIPIGTIKPPVEVETSPEQESSEDCNGGSVPIETIRPPIEVETSPEQDESTEDNNGGSMPIGTVRPPVEEASNEQDNGGVLENGCPANFDIHQLLPHESSCSRFYACANGQLVEKHCPAGTHFNPANQVCDWPENVECENSGGSTPIGTVRPPVEASNEQDNGGVLDNGCPANFHIHQLLPHESSCSRFYACANGELVEQRCPAGTHFSPDSQVCDWPENAGCAVDIGEGSGGGGGDLDVSEEITEDNGSGEGDFDVSEENTDSEETEEPGTEETETDTTPNCAQDCTSRHWSHASDCDKFWRCENGAAVLGVCSEGLHFNDDTQTCDFICNVKCKRTNHVEATELKDGLRLFVPWDKVDDRLNFVYANAV